MHYQIQNKFNKINDGSTSLALLHYLKLRTSDKRNANTRISVKYLKLFITKRATDNL